MQIGFMKDLPLSKAKDIFLFDCKILNLDPRARYIYREVLTAFIQFTGDMLVKELAPDHVRMYIATLSTRFGTKRGHLYKLRKHYAIIRIWIRWLYAQKAITEHSSSSAKAPRVTNLFPSRLAGSLMYCC